MCTNSPDRKRSCVVITGLFIKRSFRGERIHPAVFARYLRELVFQGYPVEFYIEGGRTRSGKPLEIGERR